MDYLDIRRKLKDIHLEIFKQELNNSLYIENGAKILGLKFKNKTIVFMSNNEQEAFWDFLTYESFTSNESLFTHAKTNKSISVDGNKLLEKVNVYESALYNVGESNGNTINIINIENGISYDLYDINLSKNYMKGYLMFIRLLKVEEYFMTSGFSFIFTDNIPTIIKREKIYAKTNYAINQSVTRFKAMLKINRIYGNDVFYTSV